MLMSAAAVSPSFHPRTLQFQGMLQGQSITILLDSRSTNSFLDTHLAASFTGVQQLSVPSSVQIADGRSVPCSVQIPYAEWSIQGYVFHSTLKLIPIGTYDMILGMDWLQAFSPMIVDWQEKWVSIPYGKSHIRLQGLLPDKSPPSVLQLFHIATAPAKTES